jgi:Fe-Mn family superoxide dismutase
MALRRAPGTAATVQRREQMAVYDLPDLPYDYSALEPHISGEIMQLHHDKHHKTYVDGANAAHEKLAEARDKGDFATINPQERNLAFHTSGHVLHCIFWNNLSPDGGGEPSGEIASQIEADFGSFEGFKGQFSAAAIQLQGNGWATLSWEPVGQKLIVLQYENHQSVTAQGSVPLLVLDVWEHAFYLQYKNVKPDYVSAAWNAFSWEDVSQRLDAAKKLDLMASGVRA